MQVPLQITFHTGDACERSEILKESIKATVEENVDWLEKFCSRIISCRVTIAAPHRHHRQGNQYVVRIELAVPGGQIAVNREATSHIESRDISVAIRDAFEAARRQLEDHAQKHHWKS